MKWVLSLNCESFVPRALSLSSISSPLGLTPIPSSSCSPHVSLLRLSSPSYRRKIFSLTYFPRRHTANQETLQGMQTQMPTGARQECHYTETHWDNREWWGLQKMESVAPELQLLPHGNNKGPVLSVLVIVLGNSNILMFIRNVMIIFNVSK